MKIKMIMMTIMILMIMMILMNMMIMMMNITMIMMIFMIKNLVFSLICLNHLPDVKALYLNSVSLQTNFI